MRKIEIVNREVRDVTYEFSISDELYEELKTLSQEELLQLIENTEKEWNEIDWSNKRIATPKGLNIQRVDWVKGRRHTQLYEELYDLQKHEEAIERRAETVRHRVRR